MGAGGKTCRGGGRSADHGDAEGVHAEAGAAEGLGEGGLLVAQAVALFAADVAPALREGVEAGDFGAEDAVHFLEAGGDGEVALDGGEALGGSGQIEFEEGGAGGPAGGGVGLGSAGVEEEGVGGAVGAGVVDGDANGEGGEEAVGVEVGGGEAFEDEAPFQDKEGAGEAAEEGAGGGALGAGEEEVEGAAEGGVVEAEEGDVLAGEGVAAVKGAAEALGGEFGEGFGGGAAGLEHPAAGLEFFDLHAEGFEEADLEGFEGGVAVGGFDVADEGLGGAAALGLPLEEAVMAVGECGGDAEAGALGGGHEVVESGGGRVGEGLGEEGLSGGSDGGGAGEGLGEGLEAVAVPAEEDFFGGAGGEGDVEVDGAGLADAVEAADALFEEVGVGGEVEEDEVLGELEIAAFAADFGAEEEAGAGFLGEPGGLAVALEEGEAFVEEAALDVEEEAEGFLKGFGLGCGAADEEEFLGTGGAQEFGQPAEAGGLRGVGKGRGVDLALGEAAEGGALVAKHDAPDAAAVEQLVALGGGGGVGAVVEGGDLLGEGLVALDFLAKVGVVAVAGGVEQAEAGEVARGSSLLGRAAEEEKAGDFLREALDHREGAAAGFAEVVGFVDDEEVPGGGEGLASPERVEGEEVEGAEEELAVEEGVAAFGAVFNGGAAGFVEEAEAEVEAAEQFDEPLVDKGFRDEDEDAVGPAGQVEALQNEAGFDGFAQADFVREENAGAPALGHFGGDAELVRDEFEAGADEAAGGRALVPGAAEESFAAQLEIGAGVAGARGEAVEGAAAGQVAGKRRLGQALAVDFVHEEVAAGGDRRDRAAAALPVDGFAGAEGDPLEGSAGPSVGPRFAGRGEPHLDCGGRAGAHHAQSQFRFRRRHPTLPDLNHAHLLPSPGRDR